MLRTIDILEQITDADGKLIDMPVVIKRFSDQPTQDYYPHEVIMQDGELQIHIDTTPAYDTAIICPTGRQYGFSKGFYRFDDRGY